MTDCIFQKAETKLSLWRRHNLDNYHAVSLKENLFASLCRLNQLGEPGLRLEHVSFNHASSLANPLS